MREQNAYYTLRSLPGVLILSLLFLLPMAVVFSYAFSDGGNALMEAVEDGYTYRLLSFTLTESFLSAFISVIVALPFAYLFSKYSFPGRSAILTLSALSFTIPTILVVLGFVIWYGNNGILNSLLMKLTGKNYAVIEVLYSFKAIILSHVYLNFPIAFLLITEAWTASSDTAEKASYTLGKGRMRTFISVTLPMIRGSIISAFILIFLFCFSSFAIIMVLGGNPQYSTLETEIYRRARVSGNIPEASALSLLAFFITGAILLISSYGRTKKKTERKSRVLLKAKGRNLLMMCLASLLILLFLIPPILSIVYRAFYTKAGTFTLRAWEEITGRGFGLISTAMEGIIASFLIAFLSSLAAVLLSASMALLSARKNSVFLPFLASLPMAAGSVTLGLGFSLLAAYIPHTSPIVSYALVFFAHLIIVLPFSIRTMTPGARTIAPSLSLSAYTLGASMTKTLRKVEMPLLRPYMRKAFAFSFALSLGEVNATLTLSDGHITTLPILIYRLISSYDYQGAAALGTILLLEALIVFAIGEKGGGRNAVS